MPTRAGLGRDFCCLEDFEEEVRPGSQVPGHSQCCSESEVQERCGCNQGAKEDSQDGCQVQAWKRREDALLGIPQRPLRVDFPRRCHEPQEARQEAPQAGDEEEEGDEEEGAACKPKRKAVSRKTARRRSAKRVTIPFTGGEETTTWSALVKDHGVRKASKIYRSYGGLSANPKRGRKAVRRRNPKSSFGALALRKNPGLLGILDKGGSVVSDVPVVGGFLGPKVAPIGLGLVVGGVHFYAMRYLGPKIPELGAMVGGYLGREEQGYDLGMKAQKVGYTIGGVAVATALQVGRKFAPKMFPAATVNVLSTGALLVGAAVDFIDYMRGGDSSEASMDEEFSGLAYTGGQLNGLAYEGGQLNGMHMNGAHMNGMHMNGAHLNGAHLNGMHALNEAYMRAPFEDADYSGVDFNGYEGQAFMGGPAAYMAKFGLPAMRAGRRSGMSSMAGKQGHRWAWLVRLIGFDRTAQLASMPAAKRVRIIAKMRREAKRLVDRTSSYSGLAYEGGALNGLAYEGGQLNGLAYTGGQLNGLAYTGGRV